MAGSVAELLGGTPAASPDASGPPPPPPGFVVQDSAPPPPPPGFTVQGPPPGYFGRIGDAISSAVGKLGADAKADYTQSTSNQLPANPIDAVVQAGQGVARKVGLVGDALAVPLSAVHAAVADPAADALSKIPLQAYEPPHPSLKGGLHMEPARPLTPEETHQMWASGVDTALSALPAPAAKLAARVASIYGPKAAEVVANVPEVAAVTPKGALTDEGRELAAQNGLHPQQLADAYEEAARPEPAPEPVTPPKPGEAAVWKSAEADHPVQIVGEPIQTADGRSYTPVASADGAQTHVPTEELHPVPAQTATEAAAAAPEGAPEAISAAAEPPTSEAVAARYARAQSEDVPLSQGQATQDFSTQAREDRLKGESSDAGIAARQFFNDQQTKIQTALDRFRSAFGSDATPEDRGGIVQDAVRSLRDSGKAGVSALYQQARTLGQAFGEGSGNLLQLDTAPLLQKLREIFIDEGVDPTVRNALKQQAAKYGLIGENPRTVEGETTVTLRDSAGEPAGKIAFTGAPERLTILNAEELRQKINALYAKDTTHAAQTLKPLIDDAVSKALERAATEGTGKFGETMKAARAAHVEQQQTFKNNDIVQQLAAWKKGSTDPALKPEAVADKVLGSVSDMKKVKAVLLNKPTDQSRAAWRAIQAHGVAKIFDKAMVLNSNPGDGLLGTVSGAKLNTAITKFGADKLKVLLEPSDFDQLMKLRRIVGDATIPINRTTNPSGTAGAIFRFLADKGMRFVGHIPVVGPVLHGVAYAGSLGKESLEAERTLKGITSFKPETAAPKGEQHIRDLMQAANANTALGPLLAASANENQP